MKKYWIIARGIMEETMTYRLSFIMWRFRGVLQFLVLYYLWLALLPGNQTLFGYSQSRILTYVFASTLMSAIIFSTRVAELGETINKGDLSNDLLRPANYLLMWAARDVGDKLMNIMFSIGEFTILFIILRPPFFFQSNPFFLAATVITIAIATILFFFINMLLGCIGFWSNETWAPRFIFTILLQFFSGGLFPLDILPKPLFAFFSATPFPYLLYIPLKIYLGQLSFFEIGKSFFIASAWMIGVYLLLKIVWNKGMKLYTAQGR